MTPEREFERATEHHFAGRLPEAELLYRTILRRYPDHPDTIQRLGLIAHQTGHSQAAIDLIERAIALNPNVAEYYCNLGAVLQSLNRWEGVIAAYQKAIALQPDSAETFNNLGTALIRMGNPREAAAAFQHAIALRPDLPEPYYNLANLQAAEDLDKSISGYRQAIALRPDNVEAIYNLGNALKDTGRVEEAIECYRRAIGIRPHARAAGNLLYTMHFHPRDDPQWIAQEHAQWNQTYARPLQRPTPDFPNDRNSDRPLKIGYVSPDFRSHPVGRFLLPIFQHADRSRFEIICYSDVRQPDVVTERLASHHDLWRKTRGMPDEQLAQMIRNDGIDVLVDLTMHMEGTRLLAFAHKPAPVQVTYLAYCSTTGLEAMDYRLTDPYLDPPGESNRFYVERSIQLPKSYWCYLPPVGNAPIVPLPARESGRVTFGCLNSFCKVSSATIEMWGDLLARVPHSRLLIHARPGSHRDRVRNAFATRGIDPQRIEFVGFMPIPDYFQQYQRIDIALDPFPYGGGTTTCDALWMGVPVISRRGRTAVSRAGFSILSNIGLPELVGNSSDEYVQIAAELAGDLPRLAHLRATLRQRMERSPVMDAQQFTHDLETAFRTMWRQWVSKS